MLAHIVTVPEVNRFVQRGSGMERERERVREREREIVSE